MICCGSKIIYWGNKILYWGNTFFFYRMALISRRTSHSLYTWSVPITTKVVSSNPVRGEVYSIQHYVMKFVWPATGRWFSPCTLVSSTNKTDRHDITEILLKVKRYNAIHSPFDFVDVISGMYVSRKHLLFNLFYSCETDWFIFYNNCINTTSINSTMIYKSHMRP